MNLAERWYTGGVQRCAVLVILALVAGLGCSRDHGNPRVRPLPRPDGSPALRGGGPPRSPRIANYQIDARLDVARHTITATQTLTWTNTGASPVDTLPFHLYLNAFKNDRSLFMRSSHGAMRGASASDTSWGWITVESVQLAGAELISKWKLVGPDQDETVAELALPEPVAPGATIALAFKFTAQLPEVFARTGFKGEFHLVGQWFPKIGVRVGPPGAEQWECRPFHANSEFFADFGTYDVALTVPSTYVVVGSGVLVSATDAPGGLRTHTYRAEDVHDFVWMADPYVEVMTAQAKVEDGSVEVRVVARPEQRAFARRHLQAGVAAIERFSAAYLPYPWSIMTVIDPPVEATAGAGGMEYPTVVTTAGDSVFARPGIRLPEYVTVHEIGHNWFQGILASNEPVEAWLDEGVNEWADARAMREIYGPRGSFMDWKGWQVDMLALRRAVSGDTSTLPSPIATAAFAFADSAGYAEHSYGTTLRALATLEQTVGANRFAAAMKVYAQTWAFKHPTGRDLFDVLTKELGQDLTWFFAPVFQQVGSVAHQVHTATCRRAHPPRGVFGEGSLKKTVTETEAPETGAFLCEVVIANPGAWHVPVDIEMKFADGSSHRVRWDDRGNGHWARFEVERSSRLTEVRIDPDNKLALDTPMTHHLRIDGDGSAALRAGSWFGSLTQTLMQVVGL